MHLHYMYNSSILSQKLESMFDFQQFFLSFLLPMHNIQTKYQNYITNSMPKIIVLMLDLHFYLPPEIFH